MLESGVTFTVGRSQYNFQGTASLFPAASQYFVGYKALNAALRKCRQCLAVQEVMQSKVHYLHYTLSLSQLLNSNTC